MQKKANTTPHRKDVPGENITVGNVTSSTGVAIGRGAQAMVTQSNGATAEQIAQAFAAIASKVDGLPDGPEKAIASSAVNGLQDEAQKGEQASETNVSKWFNFLAQAAPDAFQVAIATFANPIVGLGLAFNKVAERAKHEHSNKK